MAGIPSSRASPASSPGASGSSRRPALANHLKAGYLHGFVTGSPNRFGTIRLERLALLAGHPPARQNSCHEA